jgi:hypothetical protein
MRRKARAQRSAASWQASTRASASSTTSRLADGLQVLLRSDDRPDYQDSATETNLLAFQIREAKINDSCL